MPGSFPPLLRAKVAVALFVGALLIPALMSSLRGLTHVVACSGTLSAGFELDIPEPDESSEVVLIDPATEVSNPGSPGASATTPATTTIVVTTSAPAPGSQEEEICRGLSMRLRLTSVRAGVVRVDIPVTNRSTGHWRGTVRLTVGDRTFPVELGEIPAGASRTRSVVVEVDRDVERVSGEVLIGP